MKLAQFMVAALLLAGACVSLLLFEISRQPALDAQREVPAAPRAEPDLISEGREIFRHDTFGDEDFWGGTLRLHQAIAGEKNGGVGGGVSPKTALEVGLKVDLEALPAELVQQIKDNKVDLEDPATTLALLKVNAVVGVKGFFSADGKITSVGITCALCHSTVDDALSSGIGNRLDGWPNRDLNVGKIITLAPNLKPLTDRLEINEAELKKALLAWGPGKYDAELVHDGKAYRPDGKTAATLLPAAFGLAGVSLHTYTGWGSVTHWNAYVAVTQMHGKGRFFDPRMNDPKKFPIAVKMRDWDIRPEEDLVTSKLPALHIYQLSLAPPTPPEGAFERGAAQRGEVLFSGKGKCATCHVPPLFVEPGNPMHTAEEIGIDDFQAMRSPDERYRTTPLRGLLARMKGGFYHDGRFATLHDVLKHYNEHFKLGLTEQEMRDIVEYLKSL
jgi:hypothetical protein